MTDKTGPRPDTDPDGKTASQAYLRVFEQHAEGMFDQARQTLATVGVIDEPDLLRLVLARLLAQEEDASRHAAKAADLANAVARLITIRRQGQDRRHEDLPADLDAVLSHIHADRTAANSQASAIPATEGAPR